MISRPRLVILMCFLCLLLGSLWTPFPAQLIRALRGLPEPGHLVEKIIIKEKIIQRIIREEAPPAEQIGTGKAWKLSLATPLPDITLPPFPPVIPTRLQNGDYPSITELSRGLSLKSQVNFREGSRASLDRLIPSRYQAFFSLEIAVPNPIQSSEELTSVNPKLPSILKEYAQLIDGGKVSPYFNTIYSRKKNELRKDAGTLSSLLSRHNFYDTETILEIEHPLSKRKILWIQADMDVVADGSDGDRLPTMPESITKSSSYQPSTSYRWKKLSSKPNPLLAPWEKRLRDSKQALHSSNSSSKATLNNKIEHAKRVIEELKRSSFLIAEYDPFIVIPLGMIAQTDSLYSPKAGDYALVIAQDKIYPAIVGDAGPRYKSGEASLRLAKEINHRATPYKRPVSDLSVSYLVFPNSAEPIKGPINYEQLQQRCGELLNDIGGLQEGVQLHVWKDLLAPPPPTPKLLAIPKDPEKPSEPSKPTPDLSELPELPAFTPPNDDTTAPAFNPPSPNREAQSLPI